MTVPQVLSVAARSGVALFATDGSLRYEALPGRMTDDLKSALKHHKAELVETLSALDSDPVGPPYGALVASAQDGRLRLPVFELSGFVTVTDANRYVLWALGQVRSRSHHRMDCLAGLAQIAVSSLSVPNCSESPI
jgi:hypothetical protein